MLAVLTHKLVPATTASTDSDQGIFALFAKVVRTIRHNQRRYMERTIGEFVENRGGRLTDDLERQIARRFG